MYNNNKNDYMDVWKFLNDAWWIQTKQYNNNGKCFVHQMFDTCVHLNFKFKCICLLFFIINNIIIIISINSSIVKAETRFRFRRKHVWYIKSVFCIPKIEYIELKFLLKYVYFLFLQSLMLNLFNALWNIMSHFDKLKSYDDDETFSLIIIPSAC